MKKFPRKFQLPLMISMMLPTMLLGLPAIMTFRSLPAGADFLGSWFHAVTQTAPFALVLVAIAAPTIRLFVNKVLLEPAQ